MRGEPRRPNGHSLGDSLDDLRQMADELRTRAVEAARERAREAQERARKAAEAMPPGLGVRLLSSLVGLPLLILLVFQEGNPPYTALPFTFGVALLACIGGWEYFRALRLRGFQPPEGLAFVAIASFQIAAWGYSRNLSIAHRLDALLPALLAILTIAALISVILRHEPEPLANLGVTFFGVIYVGWLFSYLIFLRSLGGTIVVAPFHLESAQGAWIVLYVIAVTWSTDAGAYFTGVRFGRSPLAPRISPKKTVEGALGGLVAATLMSVLWGAWIGLPTGHCLVLGPILSILGQVGDLCESALKRDVGVKDFGTVLPGHGGVLDRFDSLLFTAPVAYYYLVFIMGIG